MVTAKAPSSSRVGLGQRKAAAATAAVEQTASNLRCCRLPSRPRRQPRTSTAVGALLPGVLWLIALLVAVAATAAGGSTSLHARHSRPWADSPLPVGGVRIT